MIRRLAFFALAFPLIVTTACRSNDVSNDVSSEELRAIRSLLEAQSAPQTAAAPPSSTGPQGTPQQPAVPAVLTPGAPPLAGTLTPPPTAPSAPRPDLRPTAQLSPLVAMVPDNAESALDGENRLVLRGTVWAVTSDRLPVLQGKNLPESAFFVFRDRDLQVFAPTSQFSFAVDYAPGELSCNKIRPCITITDELGRLHTVWYEIRRDDANVQRLHVLDCLRREDAENGEFPSDELLASNGNLAAVHRTEQRLCVRPISDVGYPAVVLEDQPSIRAPQQ